MARSRGRVLVAVRDLASCWLSAVFTCALVAFITFVTFTSPSSNSKIFEFRRYNRDKVGISTVLRAERAIKRLRTDQILLFGMHHSGTSVVARMLAELGVYSGKRRELIIRKDNPLKFWEHRKAVRADQAILSASGSPPRGQDWLGYGFSADDKSASVSASAIDSIVRSMDAGADGNAWFVKDPRISLVASSWLRAVDNTRAACVVVVRNPLEMSYRFLGYNTPTSAFSTMEWAGIWEEYAARGLEACIAANVPILRVMHHDITTRPHAAIETLRKDLSEIGVPGLKPISKGTVDSILGPKWSRGMPLGQGT